jgi:hypothetical protein
MEAQVKLEEYMKVGAMFRLYKSLGTRLFCRIYSEKLLSAKDTNRLSTAMKTIGDICSITEDRMFNDYQDLSDEYLTVFYGDSTINNRTEVDKNIIEMGREIANSLFV